MKLIVSGVLLALLAACTMATKPAARFSGEDLYARNCAACHGPSGEGDGPVASVMTITMPNLRGLAERNDGVFPRAAVREYIDGRRSATAHGDRYMPVWGTEFRLLEGGDERAARARIDAVTDFIARIQYGERN